MTVKTSPFLDRLQQQRDAAVFLFIGEALRHMEQAWEKLCQWSGPATGRRFGGESLLAKDVSAEDVIERLATQAMFGPKRLVRVKQVEAWSKAEQGILEKYLKKPNRSACLVLQSTTKKGCEALITAVKKAGGVVLEFPTPSEVELPRWLQEQASLLQKQLNLQAATLLLERSGTDLHRLAHEVEKLCDFVGERNRIEPADVDHVVCYQRQYTIFELVRAVGKCQAGRAITILRQLLLAGEAPLSILGLLARHFRILWQVQDGLRMGLSVDAIGQKIKLSSWLLKKEYLPNVTLYSTAMLFRAHRTLEATDRVLKTSGSTPEAVLETLVLSLCRLQQKGPGASASEPEKLTLKS